MTKQEYFDRIAKMWKEHADAADTLAAECGDLHEEGFHAFVANALSSAMFRSQHRAQHSAAVEAL
jgi:hypothetical protein